jgi:hypothetical protein
MPPSQLLRHGGRAGPPPPTGPRRQGSGGGDGSLDLIRVGLCLFILVTISTVHAYMGPVRLLRPGLVAWLLVLGGVFLLPRLVRWGNIGGAWPPKAIIGLAMLGALSVPMGLSLGQAGSFYLFIYLRVLVFFFLLVIAIRGTKDLLLFIQAFFLSVGVLAALSLTVLQISRSYTGYRLASDVMYDANDLGMLFVTAIPLGLLVMESTRGWRRWITAVSLVLIPAAMVLTGSRGAMVGLLAISLPLLLSMNHVSVIRRLAVVAVVSGGMVLAAPEGYWDRMATIFSPTEDYNYTDYYGRTEIAKRGVGYMLRFPLAGVGVSNFGRADGTLVRTLDTGGAVRWIAPHNTYVQVGAEMGVGALGLWLALLGAGSVGLMLRRRSIPRWWGRGTPDQRLLLACHRYLPVAFLGFAVTSYFTSHAYTPPMYILVACLTGVHLFTPRVRAADREGALRDARTARRFQPRRRVGVGYGAPAPAGGVLAMFAEEVDPPERALNGDDPPSGGKSQP